MNKSSKKIDWNGVWIKRNERFVCSWMVSWIKYKDKYLGCIGGFSGGGTFQLEKFLVKKNQYFVEFEVNLSDHLSEKEIEIVEQCQDIILNMHHKKLWIENENLILLKKYERQAKANPIGMSSGNGVPRELNPLFEKVGICSQLEKA